MLLDEPQAVEYEPISLAVVTNDAVVVDDYWRSIGLLWQFHVEVST